ncbi:CZB domain-containing protein [Pseudophaeobacter arcticus]|uniref:CZB domain-containing protein n=2 Tax=Pseudophaeobacter arcticus TaxID=385492 RepID=UPI001376869E|nr:CZB domain-containing protein [Pseudophaeobacter arcticus]
MDLHFIDPRRVDKWSAPIAINFLVKLFETATPEVGPEWSVRIFASQMKLSTLPGVMIMSDTVFREEISEAIRAHGAWKYRLRTAAMKNETNLPVQDICRDDKCRFGKWLADISPNERNRERVNKIKTLHGDFHKNAGQVAQTIADGNSAEALAALDGSTFNKKSKELTAALMEWKVSG